MATKTKKAVVTAPTTKKATPKKAPKKAATTSPSEKNTDVPVVVEPTVEMAVVDAEDRDDIDAIPPPHKPKGKSFLAKLNSIATAASKVLGEDAVYRGENSDVGEPKMFVSSRIKEFDAILHRDAKGWPLGRIIEVFGGEATCKSGLAYSLIAFVQQAGGIGVLIVAEGEYSEHLAACYGVNPEALILIDSNIVEDVFETINKMMLSVGKDTPLAIVIDSVAGLCTRAEYEDPKFDFDRQGQIRANLLSKSFRKIGAKIPRTLTTLFLVNQVNEGETNFLGRKGKPQAPGGKRIKFYSTIRLRMESIGAVYRTVNGKKAAYGMDVKVTTDKNRLAPPLQSIFLRIDFESGISIAPQKAKKKDVDLDEVEPEPEGE